MSFSVGVLYSAVDFLIQLKASPIAHQDFKVSFSKFSVASADVVLTVSQQCGWIAINSGGNIEVTERGLNVLSYENYTLRLRAQLIDLIEVFQPTWAKRIPNGRAEAKNNFPKDAEQCFFEAGLLGNWDDELIKWWDELAQAAKSRKATELLEIGRKAERLSVEYEKQRTGKRPIWQSLESNFSGFDVLSRVSEVDETPLKIEVKGTSLSRKEAYFTLTRNEWTVATNSPNYCVHLWLLTANPINVLVLQPTDILPHIPDNKADGKWETVRIPFKSF